MKRLFLLMATTLVALPTSAQRLLQPEQVRTPATVAEGRVIHVTDILNSTPEAVAAMSEFHRLKAAGLIQHPNKTFESTAVGDTANFRQLDLQTSDWLVRPFIHMAQSNVANIWLAVSESDGPGGNGHVTAADVEQLIDALSVSTPSGSFNPSAGIVVNNRAVFGDPPNVDGDGRTDVLLYDIQDGRGDGSYVAGFVTGADLPPSGPGNGRDVLHLDSNEGIFRRGVIGALATAAHELQHLIHLNYSTSEETFINEGLSEYAEIMNGYEGRSMNYLSSAEEQNRSLFYWDSRIIDYERAGLFTTYIAQRTDPLTTGSITRETANGRSGINNVLAAAGLSVEEILVDYHTATLLNGTDLSSDPDLGLAAPTFANVRALIQPSSIIDGRTTGSTTRRDTVRGGGIIFRVWENVEDFSLDISVVNEPGQIADLTLGRTGVRAIAEYGDGSVEIRDLTVSLDPNPDTYTFAGVADRITLILGHVKPVSSGAIGPTTTSDRVIYPYTATWAGGMESTLETTQYDSGVAASYFSVPLGQRYATRFSIADTTRTTLDNVEIAVYYLNQFAGGPDDETSPRDFTLHVWADAGGLPGDQIFSTVVTDMRPNQDVFQNDPLRFLEVDLSKESLPTLPSVIHVGASNAGSDGNTIVTGIAEYATENVSHIASGGPSAPWTPFWDVELQGGGNLNGEMAPMRLTVLVGPEIVAIEDVAEVPTEFALEQNYPNPFNPSTTIAYAVPHTGSVRIDVFDVLGRQVATLVDGTMAAGRYEVSVDASSWASGLYVYMLQAGDERITRNMVLLR
jgi:hypothetical protein